MPKVVLLTGVSSGFGKAISEVLSKQGYIVYGKSRKLATDLAGTVKIIQADVTERQSVAKVVSLILEREGRIDILINNAGFGISGPVEQTPPEDFHLQMDINFAGYVNMIQAVLPVMRRQGGGTIVNISSIGGLMGLPYQGFYSASKYAIEGLSEALRMEIAPFNIKVIVVEPGDFNTHFTANRVHATIDASDNTYKKQFALALDAIEKDEKTGLLPELLAHKLARILQKKNPRHHYVVATASQKLAVLLKRVLPGPWFAGILASHYRITKKQS